MKDLAPAAIEKSGGDVHSTLGAAELYRAHADFVVRFLARLGVEASDIDDLVQEVFMTAHRRGGFRTGDARPTTWLAAIATRVASTHRRTNRRRRTDPDSAAYRAAAPTPGPDEAAGSREALGLVQRALDSLDQDKRAVFVLFELEGQSCDAIADSFGVPTGTVYSRLHAARKQFRAAFEELAGDHQ